MSSRNGRRTLLCQRVTACERLLADRAVVKVVAVEILHFQDGLQRSLSARDAL